MKAKSIIFFMALILLNCSNFNYKTCLDQITNKPELLYKYAKDSNLVSESFKDKYINSSYSYLLDTLVKRITLLFSKGYEVESAKRFESSDVNNKKTQWYKVRIVGIDNRFMEIYFERKNRKWLINSISFSEKQFDANED